MSPRMLCPCCGEPEWCPNCTAERCTKHGKCSRHCQVCPPNNERSQFVWQVYDPAVKTKR